jgi:hypothetical protein
MVLPNFAGIALVLWNYGNPFFPSEWGEAKLGGYNWKAANAQIIDDELHLKVTEKASGQIQANDASLLGNARWEVDVTLPTMRPGLIAAPLWTYNKNTLDEIDFEVVGLNGLQLTIWTKVNGVHTAVWSKKVVNGDMSGQRRHLAIEYRPGTIIAFYVDQKSVARVTPNDTQGGYFPSGTQKPFLDLWAANGLSPEWAGVWRPLSSDEEITMVVHGFKATKK